ncbi:hypothetical protein [Amycolatopsis sp. NPDC059657]|uniref:hypothetical protein n=1 Tax=Amycolatopsis sp. NPDC059657 TaxID=3346899 RepID=UPI003670A573
MKSRLALSAVLTVLLLAFVPAQAWAHGDEGTDRAYDLVRQAIALIVNTPDDMDAISDKINDAIGAKDPSNVQIPSVQQAKQAADGGDLHQARSLLEQSIGARVHTGVAEPVPIGQPAPVTGADTGTVAAIDELAGRGALNGGDWIMLAISVVVGLGGVVLSLRLRPRHLPHPGPDTSEVNPS